MQLRGLCAGYSVVRRFSRSLLIHPLIPVDELHQQHPPNPKPRPPLALLLPGQFFFSFFSPSSSSSSSSRSRCSGKLRFAPRAKSRRSLHSIFVVSHLKEKSASHWRVWVRDVFESVIKHQTRFFSLSISLFVPPALQSLPIKASKQKKK